MTSPFLDGADPQLTFTVTHTDGAVTLAVAGEIDLATRAQLTEAIDRAVFSIARPQSLVVDLAGVSFMGSTGIHVLLETDKRLADLGIALHIRGASASTLRVMRLTGADTLLHLTADRTDQAERPGA